VVADALSRRPDYAAAAAIFDLAPLQGGYTTTVSNTLVKLREAQLQDPLCQQLRRDLNSAKDTDPLRCSYKVAANDTLVWLSKGSERILVPPPFRRGLISEAHEANVAGHHGVDKTYASLAEGYYWPKMWEDVH
jgi:hypothetical protein